MTDAQLKESGARVLTLRAPEKVYSDEMSLFDLWDALVRYRLSIIAIWALVVGAAVAYVLLAPPVFESRAVIKIGRTPSGPITSPAALSLALDERFGAGEPDRGKRMLASIAPAAGDDAVILVSHAGSAADAQNRLQHVSETVFQEHQEKYALARATFEAELAAIDAQMDILDAQIARLASAVASDGADSPVKALMLLQRSSTQSALLELQSRRLELQRELSPLATYTSYALRAPTLPELPVKPRKLLILALGIALGGVIAVAGAFCAEFWRQTRLRRASGFNG